MQPNISIYPERITCDLRTIFKHSASITPTAKFSTHLPILLLVYLHKTRQIKAGKDSKRCCLSKLTLSKATGFKYGKWLCRAFPYAKCWYTEGQCTTLGGGLGAPSLLTTLGRGRGLGFLAPYRVLLFKLRLGGLRQSFSQVQCTMPGLRKQKTHLPALQGIVVASFAKGIVKIRNVSPRKRGRKFLINNIKKIPNKSFTICGDIRL